MICRAAGFPAPFRPGFRHRSADLQSAVPQIFNLHSLALAVLGLAAGARAQSVLTPPPSEFSATNLMAPSANQYGGPTGVLMPQPPPEPPWLDWGPVHLRPHFLERFTYGNGLRAGPGEPANTVLEQLVNGVFIGLGDHWHLDFTPTMSFYSSRAFKDTTDYSVMLAGGTTYGNWQLGLSQSYVSSSTPLIETASQTEYETYATALDATRQLGSRISLQMTASQNFRYIDSSAPGQQLSSFRSWQTMEWLSVAISSKFSAGLGLGFGYDNIPGAVDMPSEQLQGRITWVLRQKLSLTASGGLEDRQFLGSKQPDAINPLFTVSLLYQLFEGTSFSLSASETVSPSFFNNQITDTTGFTASIRQRLFQKLFLDVSGGYSTISYQATVFGFTANSQDDITTATVRLSCPFLQRATADVFYTYSQNVTSQAGFGYTSHQTGLELGYRF